MYTLEELKQKSIKELKEIGWQLNVLPEGDRRCRQNWIDALTGVNPPLLELLELLEVETVQEAIEQVAETSPGVSSEPIELQAQEPPLESKFGRIVYPRPTAKSEPKGNQSAIKQTAETSSGAQATEAIECSLDGCNFTEPDGRRYVYRVEPTMQEAVDMRYGEPVYPAEWPAGWLPEPEKSLDVEADPIPTAPGIKLAEFWAVMNAWNATCPDAEQFRDFDIPQQNNAEFNGTATEREGAGEISINAPTASGRNICSELDGASLARHDEGRGSQEGDRLLEVPRHNSGNSGRLVSHQPAQLTQSHDSYIKPQSEEQRPPGRGEGRGDYLELAIGMLVGRRRDRLHLGKILDIYRSKRGIWRAKIQPLNKPNCAYYDCAVLIEQRFLYGYEMEPAGFFRSGTIVDKTRSEVFEVYSRKKRRSAKLTNWTPGQLSELSIFKLKQIARDMDIPSIPGQAGKRSLIRAILAEEAISQERYAAKLDREARQVIAPKQKFAPVAGKKKRAAASPVAHQLSLFDAAV